MKRIFLTLVVILIAASSSLSAHIKRIDAPDRYGYNEELPLYGDVLSMTITDVSTTYVTCKEYRFNAAGDVVETTLSAPPPDRLPTAISTFFFSIFLDDFCAIIALSLFILLSIY